MLGSFTLSISLAAAGEGDAPVAPRARIEWAAGLGYRAVQIDVTAPGMRPRELGRSARRDLASLLRRLELGFSGVDLFIPPAHFADPAHADRATTAAAHAIEFASEVAGLVGPIAGSIAPDRLVSTELPAHPVPGVVESISAAAQQWGVTVADHHWPAREQLPPGIGQGFDPAGVGGGQVAAALLALPAKPASARTPAGGAGLRLDVEEYRIALAARGYEKAIIVDLRGITTAADAAEQAMKAWGAAPVHGSRSGGRVPGGIYSASDASSSSGTSRLV